MKVTGGTWAGRISPRPPSREQKKEVHQMKFSFSTLGCPHHDLQQIIRLAKDTGYTGVELRIYQGQDDLRKCEPFQPDSLAATARAFRQAELTVSCLSSSAKFAYPGKEFQKEQLEIALAYLQMASELECSYVRIFAGPYPRNFTGRKAEPFIEEYRASVADRIPADLSREECDKWVMDGFYQVGELGKKYGVMPLMETHDDFCDGAVVRRLIEGCGCDNVGILWDCLHPYRYGLKLEDTYEQVRDRIHHVHMKDAAQLSPWGFVPALVGEGEMDVRTAVKILKDNDYQDFISFEWEKLWHPQIAEPEVAVPQFMEEVLKML